MEAKDTIRSNTLLSTNTKYFFVSSWGERFVAFSTFSAFSNFFQFLTILFFLRIDNGETGIIIEEKISKINGEISVRKYSKGKMLGKGGFAKVFEVTNIESKKSLAGKIIQKNSLTKNRARQKVLL